MPGKDGLMMMLGIGKKKPAGPPMPEFKKPTVSSDKGGDPTLDAGDTGGDASEEEQSEKLSPEKAGVSRADENCGHCSNFHSDSGECDAVDGTYSEDDRCWAAYSPKDGGEDTGSESDLGESGPGGASGGGGDYGTSETPR